MLRTFIFIAATGGACLAAHSADAYKWVDTNGVVHFSDTQPAPELKAEKVHVASKPATAAAPAAAADDQHSVDSAKPEPANTLASAVQSAEGRCQKAHADLQLLQSKAPVGLANQGGGKPVPLDDVSRQRQIASAQTLIATYCK
jgi:hypothetical protein